MSDQDPARASAPHASASRAAESGATPPRSAALTLGQAILVLESLAALVATSLVAGFASVADGGTSRATIWGIGSAVVVALALAAGALGRPRGRVFGWALQAPMIAAGAVSIAVAIVGAVFLGLWVAALRIGDRIDRERAAFREARD